MVVYISVMATVVITGIYGMTCVRVTESIRIAKKEVYSSRYCELPQQKITANSKQHHWSTKENIDICLVLRSPWYHYLTPSLTRIRTHTLDPNLIRLCTQI